MRRQRTTPILVIAILHLVGGGLGLILSLCNCGGLVMSNALSSAMPTMPKNPGQSSPPTAAEIEKHMNDRIPGHRVYTIVGVAMSFLLDVMLISGGIGLLNMQPWARWLSLAYAPLSILIRLVSFIFQLVWVLPVTQELYAQNPAMAGMSTYVSIGGGIGLFVSLLFVIYPITVLVIMLLPSTAAAFRGELPAREDDYDEREQEEDDPWREPPPPRSDKFRR